MDSRAILDAVGCLIGQPLWASARACDLQSFQFGRRQLVKNWRGELVELGQWALHVLCAWRLSGPDGIIVASRDRYYPPGDPEDVPDDFDWDVPGGNRCDERIGAFFSKVSENPPSVVAVDADRLGGLRLSLTGDHVLELFPDDSLPDERWRLFSPGSDEHFVVTGRGIGDDE